MEQSPSTLVFRASRLARVHTYLAATAFTVALFFGIVLHFKKIVKNGVAGYPEEWFPSVSSTIGDWYPERNLFQILIALNSGPRLAIVCLQYCLQRSPDSTLPTVVFLSGIFRTLSCGGWVYITSSDDHDVHDFFMITYIVLNIPWMIGGVFCTAYNSNLRRKRTIAASGFFAMIIPLIYFFIQHKVHRIPGAYTYYAFFEWALIVFDIYFDSFAEDQFDHAELRVSLGNRLPIFVTEKGSNEAIAERTHAVEHPVQEGTNVQPNLLSTFWNQRREPKELLSFASDVYLSYMFWSIFTSLTPTLFYYSVWELGIAGHESALLSTLSPILFLIPGFISWAKTTEGSVTLNLLSFIGLLAFALPSPFHRLLAVAFATVCVVLRQVADWNTSEAGYQGIVASLGFLVSSLSKHANHTNNPVWPIVNGDSGGYNKTGITLALLALFENASRPRQPIKAVNRATYGKGWIETGLPLGSLIFMLHTYLHEPSTIIAWSWTGYLNGKPQGPMPHIHGSITIIFQSIGILLATTGFTNLGVHALLSHYLWLAFGSMSFYVMYQQRHWIGYFGGLGVAIFLMSLFPSLLQKANASNSVAKTYFAAMGTYCVLCFLSILTVAYAFVPGGVYLRERTNLIIVLQLLCLIPSFRWKAISVIKPLSQARRSAVGSLLVLITILSLLVTLCRLPPTPQPWRAGRRIFRTGIWTLHFGIDNAGRDSQRGVLTVIRDMELDILGFLETDLHRTVFGNRDLTRVIVEEMGYYVDVGPGPNAHTWGCVLLSKYPIINSTHHLLPSPDGELAPAIEAVVDILGTMVTVVVAHNGQEETPLDRELQSKELARIMSTSPYPVVFIGYVVTSPGAERPWPYKILVEDGRMHDIDDEDYNRWCEYILYRGLYRTSYVRISRGRLTDTELQIGQFQLPNHGQTIQDDSRDGRYLRAFKEDLPVEHWFPISYYGNEQEGGVNGHFYHVFNTPLYYKIPDVVS